MSARRKYLIHHVTPLCCSIPREEAFRYYYWYIRLIPHPHPLSTHHLRSRTARFKFHKFLCASILHIMRFAYAFVRHRAGLTFPPPTTHGKLNFPGEPIPYYYTNFGEQFHANRSINLQRFKTVVYIRTLEFTRRVFRYCLI